MFITRCYILHWYSCLGNKLAHYVPKRRSQKWSRSTHAVYYCHTSLFFLSNCTFDVTWFGDDFVLLFKDPMCFFVLKWHKSNFERSGNELQCSSEWFAVSGIEPYCRWQIQEDNFLLDLKCEEGISKHRQIMGFNLECQEVGRWFQLNWRCSLVGVASRMWH